MACRQTALVLGVQTLLVGELLTVIFGGDSGLTQQGAVLSYTIDWGDGTIDGPNAGEPPASGSHAYLLAGDYTVLLTTVLAAGNTTTTRAAASIHIVSADQPVVTRGFPPRLIFTGDATVVAGVLYTLALSAADPDGIGTIASYSVDWGDGSTPDSGSGAPPDTLTHTYADATQTRILGTVIDADALEAHASLDLTVTPVVPVPGNLPPVVVFTCDVVSGQVGALITGTTTGTMDPDGTIVSYILDWKDGPAVPVAGIPPVNPTHTYTIPGVYQASLTCTDDAGDSTTTIFVITQTAVPVTPPHVAPTAAVALISGLVATQPTILSTLGSKDTAPGMLVSGTFEWGDGTRNSWSGAPPSQLTHPYASAGTYIGTLTVVDDDTESGTKSISLTIVPFVPPPPPPPPPPPSGGAHTNYDQRVARADCIAHWSLRTVAEVASVTKPSGETAFGASVVYDPVIDAAKSTIGAQRYSGQQVWLPLKTVVSPGQQTVLIYDFRTGPTLTAEQGFVVHKMFNLRKVADSIWYEIQCTYKAVSLRSGANRMSRVRLYSDIGPGTFRGPFQVSNGDGTVEKYDSDSTGPVQQNFYLPREEWGRILFVCDQRIPDGFTRMSYYICSETLDPVCVHNAVQVQSLSIDHQDWEINTSANPPRTLGGGLAAECWWRDITAHRNVADPLSLLIRPLP